MKAAEKYRLYEVAVQSPRVVVDLLQWFYFDRWEALPRVLREDFCGTFSVSCEWARRGEANRALCLDIDPEPLAYGRKTHLAQLPTALRARVSPLRRNVLTQTRPAADVQVVGNFSFYVFKERATLRRYFITALRSLAAKGMLVLEMAGGPGMAERLRETSICASPQTGRFQYIWQQHGFDSINHEARYTIRFRRPDGSYYPHTFEYDWRLWTIAEVRDALLEAGFAETRVYWYDERRSSRRGLHGYGRVEQGPNEHAWLVYLVGLKGGRRR